jgi:hypothetical protein
MLAYDLGAEAAFDIILAMQQQLNRFAKTVGFAPLTPNGSLDEATAGAFLKVAYWNLDRLEGSVPIDKPEMVLAIREQRDSLRLRSAGPLKMDYVRSMMTREVLDGLTKAADTLGMPKAGGTAPAPTSTSKPWYKRGTTWAVVGGVAAVGVVVGAVAFSR